MRARAFQFVLALLTNAYIIGCGPVVADNETASAADDDYFPLEVGARWEYKVQAKLPLVGRQSCLLTTSVKQIVEADGFSHYELESDYGEGITGMQGTWLSYHRISQDGIRVRLKKLDAADNCYLPLPPKLGTKWTMQGRQSEWSLRIKSLETIEIAGTTYDRCLQVVGVRKTKDLGTTEITRFYAPGVGLVRSINKSDGFQFETTLIRHAKN